MMNRKQKGGKMLHGCINRGARRGIRLLIVLAALCAVTAVLAEDPPPPCPDGDGDGYVACTGACDSTGKSCGDCNDGDAEIYRGALCALCDGPACPFTDYCVPGSTAKSCGAAPSTTGDSFCLTGSQPSDGLGLTCGDDGTGDTCLSPPASDLLVYAAEGGGTDPERHVNPTCSDAQDNDCDGVVDLIDPDCQTAEFCDGLDNDGDASIDEGFTDLGEDCASTGNGECVTSGTNVCAPDEMGVVCNAVPNPPKQEGPAGSAKCSDGKDNDCDGFTDFPADSGCTEDEICDGIDNDGDGDIDEDFADLGAACSAGEFACEAAGVRVCSGDGSETVCNAVPLLPGIEGPTNPASCGDGVDNDCDGTTDAGDESCGAVGLTVTCSLPFHQPNRRGRGRTGKDCESWHRIDFEVPQEFSDATVTAELLGLALDGSILKALPVADGDVAQLKSRLSPDDFSMLTEIVSGETTHRVYAPIPMLRVTADDGLQKATAYCSLIPYLQVFEPSGGVLALNKSAGADTADSMPVVVALPLTDPASLVVKIDGVDLFADPPEGLGVDPEDCTPDSPCGGSLMIGTEMVQVTDLIVDVGLTVETRASNTLSMKLVGLGCGGHVVKVEGLKIEGSIPDNVSNQCHVDDLLDRGTSFAFAIDITSPASLATGVAVPTPVEGEVCHGLEIESVTINAMEIFESSAVTFTPGDGDETADTYRFPIDTTLGQTNLVRDIIGGDAPAGTFDPGSNFVQAAATDVLGKRAFNNEVVFSTEQTALPGVGPLPATDFSAATSQVFRAGVDDAAKHHVEQAILDAVSGAADAAATDAVTIPDAFVVGLTADSIQNFFNSKCSTRTCVDGTNAGETCTSDADCGGGTCRSIVERFNEVARNAILGKTFGPFSAPFPCSCDPSVTLAVTDIAITGDLACPIFFPGDTDSAGDVVPDHRFRVFLELPDITVSVAGSDSCEDTFLGICIASAYASISLDVAVTDINLHFDITEDQLMGNIGPSGTFDAGVSTSVDGSLSVVTDVGCIGGDICEALVTIFTFGLIDVTPNIEIDRALEFATEVGQGEPDPISLGEIKIDEERIDDFNQTLRGDLLDVRISSEGIRASLDGQFSTNSIDPEVIATPGTWLTPAATPELPFPGASDGAVLVADDTLNMLFASLTLSGRLKSECAASIDPETAEPRTVGSLLPDDCNSIGGATTGAGIAQGLCHGLKDADCETLAGPTFLATPVEQGTCHGLEGNACSGIATGFDGIVLPSNCEDVAIGAGDSEDPDADPARSTAIAQGRCYGLAGADCETLTTGGTEGDTAAKQGACHAEQAADCSLIPTAAGSAAVEYGTCFAVQGAACGPLPLGQQVQCNLAKLQIGIFDGVLRIAEQGACSLTPAVNVSADDTVLFCARQDVPPTFVIRDDTDTDPVEVGLRLGDLSMAIVLDRDGNAMLDGALSATPPCFGEDAVAEGDCSVAALCLDVNMVASLELAQSGDCPTDGGPAKTGFKAQILEVQQLSRLFGQVCGGLPAGDDDTFVAESTTDNASLDAVRENGEAFAPPACINGLSLGGFVSFLDPRLIAISTGPTGGNPPRPSVCSNDVTQTCTSSADCGGADCIELQDYIGVTTTITP